VSPVAKRPPRPPLPELDLSKVATYSLLDRPSKVTAAEAGRPLPAGASFGEFLASLPPLLASRDLIEVADAIARARTGGKGVLLGMGAHPIKTGLGPLIAEALKSGLLTGVATNGAAIIHDYEMAVAGKTSEEVGDSLAAGAFGMALETALALNGAICQGNRAGWGIGRSGGKLLAEGEGPHRSSSVFAAAFLAEAPATVHVASGPTSSTCTRPSTGPRRGKPPCGTSASSRARSPGSRGGSSSISDRP